MGYEVPGRPDDKWREMNGEQFVPAEDPAAEMALHGEVFISPDAPDDEPRFWRRVGLLDAAPSYHFMTDADGIHAPGDETAWQQQPLTDLQYHAQSNLYLRGTDWTVPDPGRSFADLFEYRARATAQQASFEFTMEVDPHSHAFDLLFFGMTRAQHDLLHRLNITWKYRIDPGVPYTARHYIKGRPERALTPVVVTVDGRDIEALAEVRPGVTTFYPAHPKQK